MICSTLAYLFARSQPRTENPIWPYLSEIQHGRTCSALMTCLDVRLCLLSPLFGSNLVTIEYRKPSLNALRIHISGSKDQNMLGIKSSKFS